MDRKNLLSQAWTGAPLEINGREIVLSIGKFSLLEFWGNPFFAKDKRANISEAHAMGELILVCYSTKDELRVLQRITADERAARVVDFMLEFDDEISEVATGISDGLKATEAAAVEIDDLGKLSTEGKV